MENVGVREQQIVPGRDGGSLLHGVALAQPFRRQRGIMDHPDAGIGAGDGVGDFAGPVGQMIVHDHHFQLDTLLREDGVEGGRQIDFFIAGRNHDAEGFRHVNRRGIGRQPLDAPLGEHTP